MINLKTREEILKEIEPIETNDIAVNFGSKSELLIIRLLLDIRDLIAQLK